MPDCWEAMWLELEHNILIWNSQLFLYNIDHLICHSKQLINLSTFFWTLSCFMVTKLFVEKNHFIKKKSCWIFTYTFHLVTPCYLWNVFDK